MNISTVEWGGTGGQEFDMSPVRSIELRTGHRVDRLVLNDNSYGGLGGKPQPGIELGPGEYISDVYTRTGNSVDYLEFITNLGRRVGGQGHGGGAGGQGHQLTGVRVLEIGGRSGKSLDSIRFKYIPHYIESTVVEQEAPVITEVYPEETTLNYYTETIVRELNSVRRVYETTRNITTSVSAEYFAKASSTFSLSHTERKEIFQQQESETKNASHTSYTVRSGQFGIQWCLATILQGTNGKWWALPTGPLSFCTASHIGLSHGAYDLTRSPNLPWNRINRNDLIYYPKNSNGTKLSQL